MKNYKNYISLSILIIVMCGLIFVFSEISKSNNLNANDNNNGNKQQISETKPFEFVPSRTGLNSKISFENNYGGSKNDEVTHVFKLNDFYLIGTTLSNNKYFEKVNSVAVFVLINDSSGNTKSVHVLNCSGSTKIISSKIYGNYIYILVENNGTKLIEFNMSEKVFNILYSSANSPADLIISDEPVIVTYSGNDTNFYFLNSKCTISFNSHINSFMLACEYSNGTLLIFNHFNNVKICLLNKTEIKELTNFSNSELLSFNITNSNFIFVVKSNEQHYVKILNLNFNETQSFSIPNGENYVLTFANNQHYLSYTQNNFLNLLSFCNHGDILFSNTLLNNVTDYKIMLLNNNLIALNTCLDNTINLNSFNLIGELNKTISIPTTKNIKLVAFDVNYNLNFVLVGNFSNVNSLITSSFGEQDVFMCEFKF